MADQDQTFTDVSPEAAPRREPGEAGKVEPGTQVDRFRVIEKLGEGGMGVVYLAEDPTLERRVALKFLREGAWAMSVERRARLEREAKVMARLSHPNVAAVYDVGTYYGRLFVAMEYVDGGTLREWLAEPRSWREAWQVLRAAGKGLAAAHAADVVHRDFKPDNVLLRRDGRALVTDFGIAKAFDVEDVDDGGDEDGERDADRTLTGTGVAVGTPKYMAPEQHLRGEVGPRSDQFAFAVVVYEALMGEHPFAGASTPELVDSIVHGRRRPVPANSKVPRWFRHNLERALSAAPDARYGSLEELIHALNGDTVRRRRLWVAGGVAALVFAAAGVALYSSAADRVATCSDGAEGWRGVWDAEASARLTDSFSKAQVPFGLEAAVKLSAALDGYVARWKQAHVQTCRATRVEHTQSDTLMDLRGHCLDRARRAVDALVHGYTRDVPSDESIANWPTLVEHLPDLDECATGTNLLSKKPLPRDGAKRQRVEDVERGLDAVLATWLAGEYERALGDAQALVAPAEQTGYAPVQAGVFALVGRSQFKLQQFDAAEKSFMRAVRLAAAGGDTDRELDTWVSLVSLVGHLEVDQERGQLLMDMAATAFERAEPSASLEGRYHNEVANALMARGEYARAEAEYRLALERWQAAYGSKSRSVATAMQNLGYALRLQGKQTEGNELIHQSLELREEVQGRHHPEFAFALLAQAEALLSQGKLEETVRLLDEALALREDNFGPNSPTLVPPLDSLAWAHASLGRFDAAIAAARRAVAIREQSLGGEDVQTLASRETLAIVLAMAGRFAEAEPVLREAYERSLKNNGPAHPDTIAGKANLGIVLLKLERYEEARPLCQSASAQAKANPNAAPYVGPSSACEGAALLHLGRAREALPRLREAVELMSKSDVDPKDLADARFDLARGEHEAGHKRAAIDSANAALQDYDRAEGVQPEVVAAVKQWIEEHQ